LLDKAIALDPSIPTAYILKSEVFEKRGEFDAQLAALDRAKALGADDPWLLVGYARYYRRLGQPGSAFDLFAKIEARGPGVTASERKAYVTALRQLSTFPVADNEIEDRLKKYAALAVQARYPTDAWTPHYFAESFLNAGLYDEAITYARIALQTMNFDAARTTLAVALYAKAADLNLNGKALNELQLFIDEAQALGVERLAVLNDASTQSQMTNELLRAMRQVIP
jgi:tetratricopeptide (TPR) repeat protein